jgi:hypothetical protein
MPAVNDLLLSASPVKRRVRDIYQAFKSFHSTLDLPLKLCLGLLLMEVQL